MSVESYRDAVTEVRPVLRKWARDVDDKARFPAEGMRALRDSGLMGLLVPARYGGFEAGIEALVEVASDLAEDCVSTALAWAMHCQQVDAITRFAASELQAEILPRVAAGGAYLASVTTDAPGGGHLLSAHDALREDDGLLRVERDAPVVTGGADADGYLITMRADEDRAAREVSLVYADRDQVDIAVTGEWNPLGMRGTHSPALRLSGGVPPSQIVGAPGGFREVAVESMIPLAHIGWAACWLGGARGMLRELMGAARTRTWGANLDSPLVRERLARIRIDLELVSGYLSLVTAEVSAARSAGHSLDGAVEQIHINTLKIAAAELTFRAVHRMMQLSGLSIGYRRNSEIPLERVFRDLRSASLNYSDDRLLVAIGALVPLDRSVRLAARKDQ